MLVKTSREIYTIGCVTYHLTCELVWFEFVLEFAIEDWRTNYKLKNADYGRVLAKSNDGLEIILETLWKWVFLVILIPRPRYGHVTLYRCCVASVPLRSKVANFNSSLTAAKHFQPSGSSRCLSSVFVLYYWDTPWLGARRAKEETILGPKNWPFSVTIRATDRPTGDVSTAVYRPRYFSPYVCALLFVFVSFRFLFFLPWRSSIWVSR